MSRNMILYANLYWVKNNSLIVNEKINIFVTMYVYERFTFLCVKFIFIQLKYYIFYCRNEMKSVTIKLKHRNPFYIIFFCFISFLTRFSRIPHPQYPNQKNFSNYIQVLIFQDQILQNQATHMLDCCIEENIWKFHL